MIRRLLRRLHDAFIETGRDGHPPRADRIPPSTAVEAYMSAQVEPLSEHERSALALSRRVPAAYDVSPQGPRRRRLLERAEIQHLQADVEGMEVAHHDLLLASAKSGTRIPDVLALEATAYLEGEAR